MRSFFIINLLIFISVSAYCQTNTSAIQDTALETSNSERIAKYRSLMIDNVISNNKTRIKELYYQLIQQFDKKYYITLYPSEDYLLNLWLENFGMVISEIANMDSLVVADMQNRVEPNEDQLYSILLKKVEENKQTISESIRNSSYSGDDQAFLLLMLKTYTFPRNKNYRDTINTAATRFLNEYPETKYEAYTRNYIRYQYSQKGFAFGVELYPSSAFLSAKPSTYLKNGGALGIGFIFMIDKLQINTRAAFVFSGLKKDIPVLDYTWKEGEKAEIFLPEISLGYKFMLTKKISVSPVAGICWFSASPYEKDRKENKDLEDVEIKAKASPVLGIDLGWEFGNYYYYNYIYNKLMFGFYSCNLRYTIEPLIFPVSYNYMDGLMHNITLSVKFGYGSAKRDY